MKNKEIINTIFPIVPMIRNVFNIEDLKWTLKLYSITLLIPISMSIINILFFGILGIESENGFLMNFKIIWIDYFFTGYFCDIVAWRIHLFILVLCFLIHKVNK